MAFESPIYRRKDTPDFGYTFANRTHFRACGRFWLSFVQRAGRVDDEKEDRRTRNISPPTTTSGDQICNVFNYEQYKPHNAFIRCVDIIR